MKLKSYIDNTYYVLCNSYFILCIVLSFLVVILNTNGFYLSLAITMLIITGVLMFHFYARSYHFDKNELIIRVGLFVKRIKYKDIKKSYITTNNRLSYATSKKRIGIKIKGRVNEIFISPEKMDEALLKLINNTGGKRKWWNI